MLKWVRQLSEASYETKMFALNWAIYLILIIVTTVYCYARLDYVRSYAKPQTTSASSNS